MQPEREIDAETRTVTLRPDFPSAASLRLWGDLFFLAMRCPRHGPLNAMQLRGAFEASVLFGQVKVFRFDDVPRAALTYAFLSPESERRYLAGEVLAAEEWRSGPRLWLMDVMAPYAGLPRAVARWTLGKGNLPRERFFYRRLSEDGATRRIVHVDLTRTGPLGKVLSPDDFGLSAGASTAES